MITISLLMIHQQAALNLHYNSYPIITIHNKINKQ